MVTTAEERLTEVEADDASLPPRLLRLEREQLIVALLCAAVVVLHVIAAFNRPGPSNPVDEAGYLGNATYLADGTGRTPAGYYSGYSLVLYPAALLFDDPLLTYRAALVTNALLIGLVPLLAYLLSKRMMPGADPGAHLIAAVVASLYPSFAVLPAAVMAESVFVPAVLGCAYFVATAGYSPRRWYYAGACAVYSHWVSPRGVIVIAAFAIAYVVAERAWEKPIPALPLFGSVAVLAFAGRAINRAIAVTDSPPAGGENQASNYWDTLRERDLWDDIAANVFGRISYVGIASTGIAIIGVAVAARAIVNRRVRESSPPLRSVGLFAILALGATVVLSAIHMVPIPARRADILAYGRYSDGVVAPLLVVGTTWTFGFLHTSAQRLLRAAAVVVLLVLSATWMEVFNPLEQSARFLANSASLAVYGDDLSTVSRLYVGAAITAGVLLVTAMDRRLGAALLVAFLAFSSWSLYDDMRDNARAWARSRSLASPIDEVRALGVDADCVVVDQAWTVPLGVVDNYRAFVPDSRFSTSRRPNPNCGPLVLSRGTNVQRRHEGARPLFYPARSGLSLWLVLPRVPEQDRAAVLQSGRVGPSLETGRLPATAYRSDLDVELTSSEGRTLGFRVAITHEGQGGYWPSPRSPFYPARGGVRLVARVENSRGQVLRTARAPLPRALLPGDSLELNVQVALPQEQPPRGAGTTTTTTTTAPGRPAGTQLHVEFELEQIGVGPFGERGDDIVTVRVPARR
jgi:hypothetical protein